MRRAIVTLLVLLSFGLKAQVYQAMPQAGYGPVKRMLFDSVLTIPLNINQLRNITGGRNAGQIRYNVTDSGLYVYSGYQWIKANLDSTNISNRINGKLNISDTAQMLSVYMKYLDTLSLSNRINLRVKYSDTAQMLLPYLRKLDTASLSRRIDKKQDSITLTTNFKSGAATLVGATLNIPKYSDTLSDAYVPYVGANKNVELGNYNLTGSLLNADYSLQIKNEVGAGGASTPGYTSISSNNTGYYFYTNYSGGQKGAYFNYPTSGTTFSYNLPVRAGTLALVEDTVNLSNRINLKADKATVLTINGVGYDLSANRTWTIPVFDSTSLSNRLNLKLNISDTASMLSPYLRKADTSSLSNRIDLKLNISDTAAMLSPYLKSAVTSVGLSMPNAFNVANSPITSTGTIAVTGAGTAAQYIRGDGVLATYNPGSGGGGSSQVFYFNGGVASGVAGYQEMSKVSNTGAAADFSINADGYIASFLTGAGVPNQVSIPSGNWNFEIYMSSSSAGGSPSFYVELYKYNGTTFTLIASSSANPEYITNGTAIDLYTTALSVPATTLLSPDRLAVRVYVTHSSKTITMHTQNSHLSEVITTFTTGLSSLNGLIANTQYFSTGTSGSDFNISSVTDTHTFNLPTASATNRGALSSTDWSTFNGKMNYSDTVSLSNRINLKLNSSDTISLSNRINTKLNATDTASLSNRINTKADALSGTTNTVPKFTSGTTIGNSNIKDDGNVVTVNATAGSFGALQVGSYNGNILMNTTNSNGGLIFQNTSSSNKLWDFSSDNNDVVFNESNVAPVIKLKAGGNVQIYNLSGTGNRMVVADANGVLFTQAITGVDTTSLSNRINLKLNISDTASMLSGYQSAINSKQAQINGTGFVKASGTTISYDNSTYYLASNPNNYGTGTVTSVATGLGLSGGTITTSGTLLIDTASTSILSRQRAANTYYLASNPNGYTNNTGTVTSIATGLGLSGGTISTSGTLLVDTSSASILSRQRAANTYATTSSLSGYLPLTGGTLTGALGGTSATFSSSVDARGNISMQFDGTAANQAILSHNGTSAILYSSGNTTKKDFTIYRDGGVDAGLIINGSNGNVGIGTTSPTGRLMLYQSSAGNVLQNIVSNQGGSTQVGINLSPSMTDAEVASNPAQASIYATDSNYGANIIFATKATGAVGNALTTRLTIASTGNVGIGTNNPVEKLEVVRTTGAGSYIKIQDTGGSNYIGTESGNMVFLNGSGSEKLRITSGGNVQVQSAGELRVYRSDNTRYGTFYTDGLAAHISASTDPLRLSSPERIEFYTGSTERIRIGSDGIFYYGTISYNSAIKGILFNPAGFSFHTVDGANVMYLNRLTSDGNILQFQKNTTVVGSISTNTYSLPSDSNFKKNINNLDLGLNFINKLRPVSYNHKIDDKDAALSTGFIAQEMEQSLTELGVKENAYFILQHKEIEDKTQSQYWLDYTKMIPVLTKAVQELSAQIKELQTEIQTLKNK